MSEFSEDVEATLGLSLLSAETARRRNPFDVWVAHGTGRYDVWTRVQWRAYYRDQHHGLEPASDLELELFVGSSGRGYAEWLDVRWSR